VVYSGSGCRSVIPYIQCECMKILLSPGSSSVELVMRGLQARVVLAYLVSCFMHRPWPPFIAHRGGHAVYSLIISRLNYIVVDIPTEAPELSIVDSGFIITLCPIPSVLLERSRIRSKATPPSAAPCPIHHRWGVASQSTHVCKLHHASFFFTRAPFMMS
jgi:hypothetical protein